MAGHYTYGHEVNVFQPCGSPLVYWVHGPDDIMSELKAAHESITTAPYESIYVRLSGEIGELPPEYRDGFAVDYDGLLTVRAVFDTRSKLDSDCSEAAQ